MKVLATQKALFTTKSDFRKTFVQEFAINPYFYHNGDDVVVDSSGLNTFQYSKTPTFVAGKRGKAFKLNNGYAAWKRAGMPAASKYGLSFWVKPTAADLDPAKSSGWTILATNRGDITAGGFAYPNKGFSVGIYNLDTKGGVGTLNVKAYGTASVDLYSSQGVFGSGAFNFVADQWAHIAVIYDKAAQYKVEVYVNGQRVMFTSADPNLVDGWSNSFTIGDMLSTTTGAAVYPCYSAFDDIVFANGANVRTPTQLLDYYNQIQAGSLLDYETNDGIQLSMNSAGAYPTTSFLWESNTVDLLGSGFVDYGLLQAVGQLPTGTTMMFFTRTSSDGTTWDAWQQVSVEGKIQSENKRYLQVRVVFQTTNSANTPILESITILQEEYPKLPNMKVKSTDPLFLYHDLETGLSSMGVVKNAYDLIIEDQINAEEKLTFKLPIQDKKRREIGDAPVEMLAVIADRYFVVKEIIDKREDDGKLYTEFVCEARWTELRDWYVDGIEILETDPKTALETIFANIFKEAGDPDFDWNIGIVEVTKNRTLRSDWTDVLSLIRSVQETWGGEVLFDTKTKTVHLLNQIGKNAGIRFYYNKNLKNIERNVDSYDLVTRIYPTGKGDLDIKTVNGGVAYLENRTWVDGLNLRRKIIPYKWKDERYTIPQNLVEDGQKMLDEMSKPKISYKTSIHDLSSLTGHEHESFDLGDTVTAVDQDLLLFELEVVNRIVRRKQDVRKPENTEVELSQPLKTLADIQSRALDDQIQTLAASDPLSTTDAQQLTVFNQLLNSRGDDGFNSEWVKNGTDWVQENVGFSGDWSFKVTPDFGRENSLTQTVEGVSHRSSYTISAAVATEGKITKGSDPNAFVGIKVLVYYEGETTPEEHFLGIPDITTTGGE